MTSSLIVVLNWNGTDDTIECVSSLRAMHAENTSIAIVDNGSSKKQLSQLKAFLKNQPEIILLENPTNKGFAGGVNTGITYAIENDFSHVALFNNDATADKNWLKELLATMQSSKAMAVTGLLRHAGKNSIDSTGDFYTTWALPFPRSRGLKPTQTPKSGFVFGATGGATLYKTELFKEIGFFDESFFAYYEDVDISFRAQLAGHKVYYTNTAVAYHKQGATSKKIPGFTVYQTFKNLPLLYTKNVPAGLLIPIGLKFFVAYWLMFGNAIKNGTGWYALKGWLASVWYFFTSAIW